jgi:hypothetical protein
MAHTLKRAVKAVQAASDRDYRMFGLDRQEVLVALQSLSATLAQARAQESVPTAIMVALSRPDDRAASRQYEQPTKLAA